MNKVNWQTLRDILISLICVGIGIWASWSFLSQFVHVIILSMLSLTVAFLLNPLILNLSRFVPKLIATIIIYIIVGLLLVSFGYAIIFSFIKEVQSFSDTIIIQTNLFPATFTSLQRFLVKQGIPSASIDLAVNNLKNQLILFAQQLATNSIDIFFSVASAFVDIVIIIVLSFYFVIDGPRLKDEVFNLLPESSHGFLVMFEQNLSRIVGNYIRGQLTLALIVGVVVFLGCTLFLNLQNYALVLGVLAFVFETIPMLGSALASIPAIMISLLLPDPLTHTLWVILFFIIVQAIESNILGPRIVGRAVGFHPITSILVLLVGTQLFGAVGALIATPIAAACWVIVQSIYNSIRGKTPDIPKYDWHFRRPNIFPYRKTSTISDTDVPVYQ